MDRSQFTVFDSVAHIWRTSGLPDEALNSLILPADAKCLPSSFKVDLLAQSSIAASALAAALFWSARHDCPVPNVTVPAEHACVEFKSERLYKLDAKLRPSSFGSIGGLHKVRDGYVRMHDSFPNHMENALRILGLDSNASREDVARETLKWRALDLEAEAFRSGAVIAAVRSFDEWDALPQAKAIADVPVLITRINNSTPYIPPVPKIMSDDKCLRGIRVVEMSRVIAAPVVSSCCTKCVWDIY
jgi:hypothetical protein